MANKSKLLQMTLLLAVVSSAACQRSVAGLTPSIVTQSTKSASPAMAATAATVDKEYEDYRQQVLQKFLKRDYEWIEQEAHRVRLNKERLPGGYWKLRALYAALEEPPLGNMASDGDWEDLFQSLTAWTNLKPDSVTARVASADAWKNYAWKARGAGYADKVSEAAWPVFEKRLENAQQALADAVRLKEQCPYWFVVAVAVGRAQQRDRESLEKIFQAGVQIEPTFYYLHQEKATYLLPRWGGQQGDWERFADESALKIGGHEGDIVFFGIYSQMLTYEGMQLMNTNQKAAPRLLNGFRSIEKLYGASRRRLNEAALFSVFGADRQAVKELFARIGNDPDEHVWRSRQTFEVFRQGIEQPANATRAQQNN